MDAAVIRQFTRLLLLPAATALLGACTTPVPLAATRNQIIISVRDQRLTVVKDDHTRETFPISTSKFGLGDRRGTYETPTGRLAVAAKIGGGSAPGTVFHGRVRTGEIVKVDAPGRDAIVTRILALRGLEANNSQAFSRGIYIHGTPEERNIGRPTSYGCIRMRSRDVIALFDAVKVGARVQIIDSTQNQPIASNILTPPPDSPAGASPAAALATAEAAASKPPAPAAAATTTATTTVTPVTTPNGKKAQVVTTTTATTTVTPGKAPASAPPATAKKEWAGTPSQMLAKQAANEARAKKDAKPVGSAGATTHPVSNSSDDAARTMSRSVFDSM